MKISFATRCALVITAIAAATGSFGCTLSPDAPSSHDEEVLGGKVTQPIVNGTAATSYTWLSGRGYIRTTKAPLADPAKSCLSWLGGNMPPSGTSSNSAATGDLTAWATAGAPNN